jgi:hypothetical protein
VPVDSPPREPEAWRVAAGAKGGNRKRDGAAIRNGLPPGATLLRLIDVPSNQRRLILALIDLDASPPSPGTE